MDSFEKYNQKPDKAPFKKLEASDVRGPSSKFFSLPGHQELVVRKIEDLTIKEEEDGKKTATASIEHWTKQAQLFQNFAERYGIKMAKTNYLFGNDPEFRSNVPKASSPALLAVSERISGESLNAMKEVDEKAEAEIDAMFSGLFSSLHDSYKENGYSWGDFGNWQMMYGTAPKENEPHVYIVDIGPQMTNWSELPAENKEVDFWIDLEWIVGEMRTMEKKIRGKKKKFETARKVLSEIVSQMPIPTDERAEPFRKKVLKRI
jgi:hypothetical protein